MMNKDDLEEYIYENFGDSVDISDEMFNLFKKNGRLDITITEKKTTTTEQSSGTSTNPFEKVEDNKETKTNTTTSTTEFNIFGTLGNTLGYQIISEFVERDYVIIEGIIRRGQSAYKALMYDFTFEGCQVSYRRLSNIEIHILEKISYDISLYSTGMDNRRVLQHIIKHEGDEIWIMASFDIEDGNGPVIGKYRLRNTKDIAKEIQIF